MTTSVFKSPERRDRMRAFYDGILNGFPFEKMYIETPHGRTFVLAAGDRARPPVVLLHGSGSNSAFWFPEMTALSAAYRVYAVDILGEAGNSAEYRLDLESDAFADWMLEVQNALGIERSDVIGNSLGGWMGLKFAVTYPSRVSKLILIVSAGLAPIRHQFLQNVRDAKREDGTVAVTSDIIGESGIPKEVLAFMNLIAESYDPIQELPLFRDEQLQKLSMPVLFMGGEEDVIVDAKASAARLSRVVPSAQTRLIPNRGHVITDAIDHILPFLGGESGGRD